jgi:signal transduction histidine kinase
LAEPFFTTKEPGKGTGLGLSISRTIMQQHGGELSYDAASPNTRFVIRLPALSELPVAQAA